MGRGHQENVMSGRRISIYVSECSFFTLNNILQLSLYDFARKIYMTNELITQASTFYLSILFPNLIS
jgi:hypothetical protein